MIYKISIFIEIAVVEDERAASSASGGTGSGETIQGFDDLVQEEPVHGDQDQDTKPGPYKCTVCGENYLKEKQLREHEQVGLNSRSKILWVYVKLLKCTRPQVGLSTK